MKNIIQRGEWKRLIQKNDPRVNRFIQTLFSDMTRSIPFLLALLEVTSSDPLRRGVKEHIGRIRSLVRMLDLSQLETVTNTLLVRKERGGLFLLTLGAYHDEVRESVATMRKLADIADRQNNMLNAGASSATVAMITLIEAGALRQTSLWTNFLEYSHELADSAVLEEVITSIIVPGQLTYRVVPYPSWDQDQHVLSVDQNVTSYLIPGPDELVSWLKRQLDRIFNGVARRDLTLSRLAETMRENPDPWRSAYEDMWLEMMIEAQWALRDDGLDSATVSVPELHAAGHRSMRFYARESFPDFRVIFRMERTNGADRFFEMNLEPSDLLQVHQGNSSDDDSILFWVDRILAFTAVRAVWTIVMGHLSRKPRGTGAAHHPGSAIVRSRFRSLPHGFKASPEARARALEQFSREPLPGRTFVREYQRGDVPQSGDPLFAITNLQTDNTGYRRSLHRRQTS